MANLPFLFSFSCFLLDLKVSSAILCVINTFLLLGSQVLHRYFKFMNFPLIKISFLSTCFNFIYSCSFFLSVLLPKFINKPKWIFDCAFQCKYLQCFQGLHSRLWIWTHPSCWCLFCWFTCYCLCGNQLTLCQVIISI